MGVYYYGRERYEDYLRGRTLKEIKYEINHQTKEILGSQEALARNLRRNFELLDDTLRIGFRNIEEELSDIRYGLEKLRSDFIYGMGILITQVIATNVILLEAVDILDEIREILKSPLLTQSREFFRIGLERLKRGLIPEALDAFLKAEEKNETDFFIQAFIGLIYLYDKDLVNLKEAEKHLKLAVRYGLAEIPFVPYSIRKDFEKIVGEICLHTSISIYVQVNEPEVINTNYAYSLIKEAREYAKKSIELNPELAEGHYHYAKFSALLGESKSALPSLRKICDDWNYWLKVDIDKDFDNMREEVLNLFKELKEEKGREAKKLLQEKENFLQEYIILDKKVEQEIEKKILEVKELIKNDYYLDYLDAIKIIKEIDDLILKKYITLIKTLEGHTNYISCLAFSPHLNILASGSSDKTIKIWDMNKLELIKTLKGHTDYIYCLAFSPHLNILASGSNDKTIKIWKSLFVKRKIIYELEERKKKLEEKRKRLEEEIRKKEEERIRKEEEIRKKLEEIRKKEEETAIGLGFLLFLGITIWWIIKMGLLGLLIGLLIGFVCWAGVFYFLTSKKLRFLVWLVPAFIGLVKNGFFGLLIGFLIGITIYGIYKISISKK